MSSVSVKRPEIHRKDPRSGPPVVERAFVIVWVLLMKLCFGSCGLAVAVKRPWK